MEKVSLSKDEQEQVYKLASQILGIGNDKKYKKEILIKNIERRMRYNNQKSLITYLNLVNNDDSEFCYMISALTIHTTSWFREVNHFLEVENHITKNLPQYSGKTYKVLSAGCSTGEEVYSLALILETIREKWPTFEYQITGQDIDPVSIEHAQNAIYRKNMIKGIPERFHHLILKGKNHIKDYFTLNKVIRKRCHFEIGNFFSHLNTNKKYDLIFCRNVLIYFDEQTILKTIQLLTNLTCNNGILVLGHSEALHNYEDLGLKQVWNSSYTKSKLNEKIGPSQTQVPLISRPAITEIKVTTKKELKKEIASQMKVLNSDKENKKTILVVDDSLTIRKTLQKIYTNNGFEVVLAASAAEGDQYLKKIANNIDLISLDLHMPGMDGATWLSKIRDQGVTIPVIVITDAHPSEALGILKVLERGAQDYINKSLLHKGQNEIIERIKAIIGKRQQEEQSVTTILHQQKIIKPDLILIGASTGGTVSLTKLLENFQKNTPPIIIVQHIDIGFVNAFAERLASVSGLKLGQTQDGTSLESGTLYVADGEYHIGVIKIGNQYKIFRSHEPAINRHRPSVDFLFSSAVKYANRVASILLTGMGNDGASAMLKLKKEGAMTFAQNEESCVVYGMPKEAIKMGAANLVGDITGLRKECDHFISLNT